MTHFLYFAYGSNIASARLLRRCPSTQALGMATLADYEMTFDKLGLDGSAKCGIYPAEGETVYGALFRIHQDDLPALDAAEGQGVAYQSEWVEVTDSQGKTQKVLTYIPLSRDAGLVPKCWYKEHVLRGAKEFSLPEELIKSIEAMKAWPEEDAAKAADELSIYQ